MKDGLTPQRDPMDGGPARHGAGFGSRHLRLGAAVLGVLLLGLAVGGIVLTAIHGPPRSAPGAAAPTGSPGPVSTDAGAEPSASVSVSVSPSASVPASASAPASAPPAAPAPAGPTEFPVPGNTGVPAGTNLTTVNGDVTLSRPGQVLENKRVTGSVTITANNVVIRNSEIYGNIDNWNGGNPGSYTITDTTVGPPSGCDGGLAVGVGRYTATRVLIRNHGDGFRVSHDNVLIQHSFVRLCSNPGDHSDGVQGYGGGTNVTIRHNTIDQRPAHPYVTAVIFMSDGSKHANIFDNLLLGGGFAIQLHNEGSSYQARGNRIVDRSYQYAPVRADCGAVTLWSDNRLVTVDGSYRVTSLGRTVPCSG